MLKSYQEVNAMEESLKTDNFNYYVKNHENYDDKTKENKESIEFISNLIEELLKQLSNHDITDISEKLYDLNLESKNSKNNSFQKHQDNKKDTSDILRTVIIKNMEKELKIIAENCQKLLSRNLQNIDVNKVQEKIEESNINFENVEINSNNKSDINYENIKSMKTTDLQERYNELVNELKKYQINSNQETDNYFKIIDEMEKISNLLVSRGEPIILPDNHKENISLEQTKESKKINSEDKISGQATISSFNQELNSALNKAVTGLKLSSEKLDDTSIPDDDKNLENQFKKILQKNLKQAEDAKNQEKDIEHKENLKNILNISSSKQSNQNNNQQQFQEMHEQKLKSILNSISFNQDIFNFEESQPENEKDIRSEDQSKSKNSTEDNEIEKNKSERKEKNLKSKKIKSVRKPKKNIFKRLVTKISTVAVTLVLICAGGSSIVKTTTNQKDNETLENNLNNLDDSSMQITYNNTDKDKSANFENMQLVDPFDEVSNYSASNDGFLIDNESNSYLEDNLTYLDSEIEPYNQYKSNKYNENSIQIGSEVTVKGNIYQNVFDAYFQENSHVPPFDNDIKRIVLGVGINDGQEIIRKYAYDENVNEDIQQMINNGGEIVTVLTANKDKYLSNYGNTEKITKEQLKVIAEGWYNINDVNLENMKGLSK